MMKLSGAQEVRPDWRTEAEGHLTRALRAELAGRQIAFIEAGPGAPERLSTLAHAVLPAAFVHARLGDADARDPLATARDLPDWTLGPIAGTASERSEFALVIAPQAVFTSGGHQAAQVGLGLAFGTLVSPDGGARQLYGALIETGTGDLVALSRIGGGDVRNGDDAMQLIEALLNDLIGHEP